jgi:hypothetical protein
MRKKGCGGIVQCRKRPVVRGAGGGGGGNGGNGGGTVKCYAKAVAKCG